MPPAAILEVCDELARRQQQIYRSLNAIRPAEQRRHRAHRRPSAWKAFWAEVWRPIRCAL